MSTRAIQIGFLLSGIVDPLTGLPLVGVVYFYAAGTDTPKIVWTEKEKLNAYTYIVLDTGGIKQIYGEGVYKLIITRSSDGTVVRTWDNIKLEAVNTYVLSINTNTPQTTDHDIVLVDTSSGNVTYTLLAASAWSHPVIVKNIGTNSAIIAGTIDGSTNLTLGTQNQSVIVFSNGTNIYSAHHLTDSLVGLTATINELNTACDGVLATATEINRVCDGAETDRTATIAEINATCDGFTSTVANLNSACYIAANMSATVFEVNTACDASLITNVSAHRLTTNQTIGTSLENIIFNEDASNAWDDINEYNSTTGVWTAIYDGTYWVHASFYVSGAVAADVLELKILGTSISRNKRYYANGTLDCVEISGLIKCVATNTISIQYADANRSTTVLVGSNNSYLSIVRVK